MKYEWHVEPVGSRRLADVLMAIETEGVGPAEAAAGGVGQPTRLGRTGWEVFQIVTVGLDGNLAVVCRRQPR